MEVRTTNLRDEKAEYYDAGGITTKDVVRAKLTHEQYIGWCLGQSMTYLMRAQWKHEKKEDEHRDYEKAIFYLKETLLVDKPTPEQYELDFGDTFTLATEFPVSNSLAKEIEDSKARLATLPEWARKFCYFEGGGHRNG
jgi:hypothetical protein